MPSLGYWDVFLRLAVAMAFGSIIGLDRELRGKPAGLRTVALVSLGSAVFVLTAASSTDGTSADSAARVIQGIVTGIGFLGAGTIIHQQTEQSVKGLTTAASIWLAAAGGVACGLAQWPLVAGASVFGVLILVLDPFEDWLKGRVAK